MQHMFHRQEMLGSPNPRIDTRFGSPLRLGLLSCATAHFGSTRQARTAPFVAASRPLSKIILKKIIRNVKYDVAGMGRRDGSMGRKAT